MPENLKMLELFEMGCLEEAEMLVKEALARNPDDIDARFLRGKIYCKREEWGRAINQFQRVLEEDPDYPEAKEQIEMINSILGYFTPDMFNP